MSPRVSILVPVYNAESHLARCIESVRKQDFVDFELILVDDGSTDGSGSICDSYAEADERIRVIHKQNTGVSDSRNMAIMLAKGEFLQFLDSDDWISTDATGLLVRTAEEYQCDMVISDFYRVVGDRVSHKGDIQENGLLTREEFATYMMEKPADFYYGVLWNKLYRREIVRKYELHMDAEISWCEDFMFNMEYIRHIKNVYALHVPIYYYVKTKGSLVSQGMSISKTIKMKRIVFECYNNFYKDVFNEDDYEKSRMRVYRFLLDAAGDGVVPPAILPGSIRLGDERTYVSMGVMEGEGILWDVYREKKLLDRYLETAALKRDLSLDEIKLLLYLSQSNQNCSLKEIAEVMGISKRKLTPIAQKLMNKEIIKLKKNEQNKKTKKKAEKGAGKKTDKKTETGKKSYENRVEILPAAEPILNDLLTAKNSFELIKYTGLSEEEQEQYALLSEKIKSNIRRALK